MILTYIRYYCLTFLDLMPWRQDRTAKTNGVINYIIHVPQVLYREIDNSWWVDSGAEEFGPFESEQFAQAAADHILEGKELL